MGDVQELELNIIVNGAAQQKAAEKNDASVLSTNSSSMDIKRWTKLAIYSLFVLLGQTVATLLGRMYYDKGGKSTWLATLVQLVGFPVLFPCYLIRPTKNHVRTDTSTQPTSVLILAAMYIFFGLFVAADTMLYSIGLLYLPVSTYSLICASQLAFNAFFSFFVNSQKFTILIVNSLILLTLSSTLLIFNSETSDQNPDGVSKGKYAIGFLCTVGASAGYGLLMSLTQLAFKKVIKNVTLSAVLDLAIYESLVASCAILVGLFTSGDWKTLTNEMDNFQSGKLSYLMNLIWTAIAWQVYTIGAFGLIFEVSALFSNAISALGLPIVPCLAVVFFHDKMGGLKVIAMILAIWGFVSYVYQNYIDYSKSKRDSQNVSQAG